MYTSEKDIRRKKEKHTESVNNDNNNNITKIALI